MNKTPTFSVIMALYNKRPYVTRAVDSVMSQRGADFELIVVDDGSTDGSLEQITDRDHRVRIIRQANQGPSSARNNGIRHAKGRFITFIDADDYYYDGKLERSQQLLSDHTEVDWSLTAFDWEMADKSIYRGIKGTAGNAILGDPVIVNNALLEVDISGIHINGVCMKKELIQKALEGFNEKIQCHEITDLLVRCAMARPRVLLDPKPAFRVVDVPQSAFKSIDHRSRGARHMSQLYTVLSADLERSMKLYRQRAATAFFAHVRELLASGRRREARELLIKRFPFRKRQQWWKFFLLSLAPTWSRSFLNVDERWVSRLNQ